MNSYQSRYAIGQRVLALGNPGKVVAITFTEPAILYEIEFEAGGAHSVVDTDELRAVE